MLAYAALSISMHTQSIFAISVFGLLFLIYKFVKENFFLIWIVICSVLIIFILAHSFLQNIELISPIYSYVTYKIQNYSDYSNRPRITLNFYLLISLSVLFYLLRINLNRISFYIRLSKAA